VFSSKPIMQTFEASILPTSVSSVRIVPNQAVFVVLLNAFNLQCKRYIRKV
jgi:hypothetical protein